MSKPLAALISLTIGLCWIVPFGYFTWLWATGMIRVRRKMAAAGIRLRPFYPTGQILWYARKVDPQSPDSQRLRRGYFGAIFLIFLLFVLSFAMAVFLHRPAQT
jgi:hypothetical protein